MGDNMDRDVWEPFFSLDTLEDEFNSEAVQDISELQNSWSTTQDLEGEPSISSIHPSHEFDVPNAVSQTPVGYWSEDCFPPMLPELETPGFLGLNTFPAMDETINGLELIPMPLVDQTPGFFGFDILPAVDETINDFLFTFPAEGGPDLPLDGNTPSFMNEVSNTRLPLVNQTPGTLSLDLLPAIDESGSPIPVAVVPTDLQCPPQPMGSAKIPTSFQTKVNLKPLLPKESTTSAEETNSNLASFIGRKRQNGIHPVERSAASVSSASELPPLGTILDGSIAKQKRKQNQIEGESYGPSAPKKARKSMNSNIPENLCFSFLVHSNSIPEKVPTTRARKTCIRCRVGQSKAKCEGGFPCSNCQKFRSNALAKRSNPPLWQLECFEFDIEQLNTVLHVVVLHNFQKQSPETSCDDPTFISLLPPDLQPLSQKYPGGHSWEIQNSRATPLATKSTNVMLMLSNFNRKFGGDFRTNFMFSWKRRLLKLSDEEQDELSKITKFSFFKELKKSLSCTRKPGTPTPKMFGIYFDLLLLNNALSQIFQRISGAHQHLELELARHAAAFTCYYGHEIERIVGKEEIGRMMTDITFNPSPLSDMSQTGREEFDQMVAAMRESRAVEDISEESQ